MSSFMITQIGKKKEEKVRFKVFHLRKETSSITVYGYFAASI